MIVAGQRLPILIATKPVDFRCGHQALALMVQTELRLDPHSGVTVVFRAKRGDRLKILVWEDEEDQETVRWTVSPTNGMVLIYKVLEQGNFAWVKTGPGGIGPSSGRIEGMNARSAGVQDGVMRVSRAQAEALFEGLDWRRTIARRVQAPTAAG